MHHKNVNKDCKPENSQNIAGLPENIIGINCMDYMKTLPILRDLVICREASSHDRKGGNDNGFSNKAEWIRKEKGARVVALDEVGPGCIYSTWYSWPNHDIIPRFIERASAKALGRVKFFLNGDDSPEHSFAFYDLDGSPPFDYPLTVTGKESTGGHTSYIPIPFSHGMKVTIDGGRLPMYFNHFWYHMYPMGTKVSQISNDLKPLKTEQFHPQNILKNAIKGAIEVNNLTVKAGSECDILSLKKEGTITCIRMKLPENDNILKSIWLRIHWDNDIKPSVDVPLSLFYAIENRFSEEPAAIITNAKFQSTVVGQDDDGMFYFRLPMPFLSHARITLINQGSQNADIDNIIIETNNLSLPGLGTSAGYFSTKFTESRDLEPGRDYLLADLKGRGHIVGTVLSASNTPETFLEGDERIYTDNCRSPHIMGDATETYFNGSWYFSERAFSCPLHGAPTFRMKKKMPGSISDVTMYRFHLTDLIPFRSRVRFFIQHGPFNDVPGQYRSVVFYYGLKESGLVKTDVLNIPDPRDRKIHDFMGAEPICVEMRSGFFEGVYNGQDLGLRKRPAWVPPLLWVFILTVWGIFHTVPEDSPDKVGFTVAEHDKPFEFKAKISPKNCGIMLRRLFDQSIPDQRARIEVDGELAGIWFNAGQNKWKIWAEDDLILKPDATAGKSNISIRIIPESKIFTASEYSVFSIVLPKG